MEAQEILRSAQDLVARGWCQGADARDASGRAVRAWDRAARSWSLLGAVVGADGVGQNAVGLIPVAEVGRAIVAAGEAADTHSLQRWNDDPARTAADVIAVLDRAIALLSRDAAAAASSTGRN